MKEQDKNNTEAFNTEQKEELQDTLLEGVTGGEGDTGGSKRPVIRKPTSYPVTLL